MLYYVKGITRSVFCLSEEVWSWRKVNSCPPPVHSGGDMFEVTAMERQGSPPHPGAKWIQMFEHVHKVESTCTVVVFPFSKGCSVASFYFIFPGALSLALSPFFPLSCPRSVSLSWQIKMQYFNKHGMSKGFNDPVRNRFEICASSHGALKKYKTDFFLFYKFASLRKLDFLFWGFVVRFWFPPPHLTKSKIKPWYFWAWSFHNNIMQRRVTLACGYILWCKCLTGRRAGLRPHTATNSVAPHRLRTHQRWNWNYHFSAKSNAFSFLIPFPFVIFDALRCPSPTFSTFRSDCILLPFT